MIVYAIALGKGGTTKTTTSAEEAAFLAGLGYRVLAIDLDQQGNLSTRLGITNETEVDAVAADVLTGEATVAQAAIPSPSVPGVWVLVGTVDLGNLDHRPEIITSLRDYLPELEADWDFVVIDTPPAMGLVTLAALAAADIVIASVSCEAEAFDQVSRLEATIQQRVAPRLRVGQRVHWIIPTKYDGRRSLDREVVEALEQGYPGRVTNTVREAVAAKDAYTAGKPVSIFAPKSGVAGDYKAALTTILAAQIAAVAQA